MRGLILNEPAVQEARIGLPAAHRHIDVVRVDFDRLRRERLARAKQHLQESELGALLCFDMNNIRYITATHIGTWAMDKLIRFALLTRNSDPILWDFGSAARHHQLYCPWLGDRSRPGISTLRASSAARRNVPSPPSTSTSSQPSAGQRCSDIVADASSTYTVAPCAL